MIQLQLELEFSNDLEQVVGGDGGWNGFLWDRTNGLQSLPISPDPGTLHAINNSGQVLIGHSVWEDGTMTEIGPPDGDYQDVKTPYLYGINDAGQVVGSININYQPQAFIWENGETTLLGGGVAHAINNAGQIVGEGLVLWEDGVSTNIGPGSPCDINDDGLIVGSIDSPALWDLEGNMVLLDSLLQDSSGWDYLLTAKDINNSGQIVGRGVTTGGQEHAFLMTPIIPEPATLLLLGLGVPILSGLRRKW